MMYLSANQKAISLNLHRYNAGASTGGVNGGERGMYEPQADGRHSAARALVEVGDVVYTLSTRCIHVVYTSSIRCLHVAYMLSTRCLRVVYPLSTS
jgi:hypothetical protein